MTRGRGAAVGLLALLVWAGTPAGAQILPEARDEAGSVSDLGAYSSVWMRTNEPWTDADEGAMGIPTDHQSEFQWEGPFPEVYTNPDVEHYWADPNEVDAVRPKLQTYHQTLLDYQRKRRACEADHQQSDSTGNRLCYPQMVHHAVQTDGSISPGCHATASDFAGLRYGRFCGLDYPLGHAFDANFTEPIDGVDYCCRLHDFGIWSWEVPESQPVEVEDIKACGMVMCLTQASGFPSNVTSLMPAVEEARECWYEWAALACEGNQPDPIPPLGLPTP